ncbi:glycosyltransferase [Clostridium sp. BJN0001]|uniref:glycosyltransferase n=1 Tax=Clostridium sp. BJN0001 TaxID=2930219 RepID=UPI001FD4E41F|nr:glycosyltransferase [Clostridium sp. BJN0001]
MKNKLLIIGTVITSVIYLFWRIFFTIPFGYGIISLIAAFYLLIVEILGMIEEFIHYHNMSYIDYPKLTEDERILSKDFLPHVDVFIATYNEPVELLYKTINGCINMEYPDKDKVHIYICDDSNRKEMRKLANHMGVNYLTRKEHKDAKAGNLNNALKNSSSPLIVTFDADMIPMHDFLTACVPYFIKDLKNAQKLEDEYGINARRNRKGKIGFIQTPQSFYNPDLFQYNLFSESRIPNEQDYFYRDIQVSRNKSNSVIYGGSNTMISREALIDVGGFYVKAITEDFATGMKIQSKGYLCYAIDEVHASGLSAEDLKGLIKQRQRWARGCIQTGRRLNILFRKGLNLSQKLSYMSAIMYWYSPLKRLIYIMAPILFAVFGVTIFKCNIAEVLIFWLPMYLFSSESLKRVSRNIRTTKWTNVYETILFPALFFSVLLETFGISQNKFAVTRKGGALQDRNYQLKQAAPHIVLAILSIIGIINCIKWTFILGTPAYLVLLFWLVTNFYNIFMSIFFMLGRQAFRKSERMNVKTECSILFEKRKIKCMTKDISEGGVSVILDDPFYIPYDKSVKLKVSTERYTAIFDASVVHAAKIEDKWKFAFKIEDIDEDNYKNLLGIIYDRVPSLPSKISKSNSIFDDIRLNVLKRGKKTILFNRKLPRISMYKKISINGYNDAVILNFNYQYIVLKFDMLSKNSDYLEIKISDELVLQCEKSMIKYNGEENEKDFLIYIFEVKNYKSIFINENSEADLFKWLKTDNFNDEENTIKDDSEFNEMNYLNA